MTREKQGSSSRSKTSEVKIGDTVVGVAAWDLHVERQYVDATMFGDENKLYLMPLPEIQGSFSGDLEPGAFEHLELGREVSLYVPKKITKLHGILLDLLGRQRPMHAYAKGAMTDITVTGNKASFNTRGITLYPDPGTLPDQLRQKLRAKREELSYRLWDRFLRPVVVIDQDEWQADEYESRQEELWYEAMERAEHD